MMRFSMVCFVLYAALLCVAPAALQAQEKFIPRRQSKLPGPPLSPQDAIKKMTVPDGFQVELVAAEPDIVNPIAMTFDERGRIWITESLEYPRRSPGKGRDRIKVLEDTNGDGKADKATIFAEGLNIPSGIAVGYGGVWVANAPDILFMQDTDGDGKADKTEVVVTGFGRTDTHELPNSLTWGPDGWLYGLNGVFNYSNVKYRGKEYKFTCTMFRIHPRTREFELFAEGTSNPWGIAFDNEGSAFISACVIDHLWHISESGYYHRQGGPYPPHTWKMGSIVKHKHQLAAYCGIHYFDCDAYPPEYRRRLYMGNIHGNCINVDVPSRDGSTYSAKPAADFLTANDVWFMPVVQKSGPDGSLYVLDWYDRYHCYQDANRDPKGIDRLHGRLYRVRYKNTPRVSGFDLSKQTDAQLIKLLSSGNDYFRWTAQRILSERNDPATRPKLKQLVLDDSAPQTARRHALWTLISTDALDVDLHHNLLTHKDAGLQAWAVRAAGNMRKVDPRIRDTIISLAKDSEPKVQLQVATVSRKIEDFPAIPVLLTVLANSGDDKLLPHIVWQNLHPLIATQTESFLAQMKDWKKLGFPRMAEIMPRVVARILDRADPSPVPAARLFSLLAEGPGSNREAAAQCLATLSQRIQNGEIRGERLVTLRNELDDSLAAILQGKQGSPLYLQSALLATTWKDAAGVKAVRNVFSSTSVAENQRLQALDALIAAGDQSLLIAVDKTLADRKQNSAQLRGRVVSSLGRLNDDGVADVLIRHYGTLEPEMQPRVVELLTQRVNWSKSLMAAIGAKKVPAAAVNLNQARRLLRTGDKELAKQVGTHWGTIRDKRDPKSEELIVDMKRMIRSNPGDPFAGKAAFKKVCGQCHKLYGEGAEVGPDITLNGRNSFDQLLSNVFDPSLVIGASYRAQTVVTADGRVLTGLLVEDSKKRIVLKVQGDKLETIVRSDVELSKTAEVSMMPEQLEKQLKRQEIIDLFAYITLDRPPGDPNARQLPGVREVQPRETKNPKEFNAILAEVAPGFRTSAVGEGGLALLKDHSGRSTVVRTHPVSRSKPCVLRGTFEIPAGKKSRLNLSVSHHTQGDWQLIVKVNGRKLHESLVGPKTTTGRWADYSIDLSPFAGKKVQIELHNHPNNWANEFGYWGRAAVVSE